MIRYKEVYLTQGWEMVHNTSFRAEHNERVQFDLIEHNGTMHIRRHEEGPEENWRCWVIGPGLWVGVPEQWPFAGDEPLISQDEAVGAVATKAEGPTDAEIEAMARGLAEAGDETLLIQDEAAPLEPDEPIGPKRGRRRR